MGFKKKTELINVSGTNNESASNTFTELQVSLDLDPLSREIFVVTDAYLDCFSPTEVVGTTSVIAASLTNVTRANVADIGDSQCITSVTDKLYQGQFFSRTNLPVAQQSTGSPRDYLTIISTPNFFCQVAGTNNTSAKGVHFRLTGFRATADADTYSALVASEVLSV